MPDVSSTAPERGAPVGQPWMCTSSRSSPRRCRRRAARPSCSGSRTPSARSAASSTASAARTGWRSAMRPGPAALTCCGCSTRLGVACDVIAPSLVPVRAGDRVKTDRRDAKKLVRLYRAGELTFVRRPTPQQKACATWCAAATICAARGRAARHRVAKALLRHGRIFREGKKSWTLQHYAWVRRQRLADALAQRALEHMLAHLDGLDAQIDASSITSSSRSPTREPWSDAVAWLCCFRGISTLTALGLLAEIGDFRRFGIAARADELPRPDPQRVLLRRPATPRPHHQVPATSTPAGCWSKPPGTTATPRAAPARRRLAATSRRRHDARLARPGPPAPPPPHLAEHGKRSTVTNVAIARELTGFLWAAMTHQPLRDQETTAA